MKKKYSSLVPDGCASNRKPQSCSSRVFSGLWRFLSPNPFPQMGGNDLRYLDDHTLRDIGLIREQFIYPTRCWHRGENE